jgi:peptide/nickel transport system ATP-binding protein
MTVPVLSVRSLSIEYRTRRGPLRAVRDATFDLEPGETLAITGESGCGKTTLAVGLVRLSPPSAHVTSGEIRYDDGKRSFDVLSLDAEKLRRFRWADCAMVFQAALSAFNPVITIWEQFLDTGRAHGMGNKNKVHDRARELLDLVHLDPTRVLRSYPHELSGGTRQRILIAMALLLDPRIVILDEPTTALDILTQRAIIDLLRDLRARLGFATIFISHDLSVAAELADRIVTMYAGRIVERAGVEDLFYRPRHPYSVALIRAVPRVSGALGNVASIPGSAPDLIRLPPGCSYYPRCPFHVERCLEQEPPLLQVDRAGHEAACIRWEAVAAAVGAEASAPAAERPA